MKRRLPLLLAALVLVFALTACGGGDESQSQNGGSNGTTENQNGTTGSQNGTAGTQNGGNGNDSAVTGGGDQNGTTDQNNGIAGGLEDAGEDLKNGMEDVGDALTGNDSRARTASGSSYSQMVQNARVHDRDGDLTDGENAVTPGSGRI